MNEKIRQLWEISKEQEAQFMKDIDSEYCTIPSEIEVDDLFKLIRGAEYRRDKEDGIEEKQKEFISNIERWYEKLRFGKVYYDSFTQEAYWKVLERTDIEELKQSLNIDKKILQYNQDNIEGGKTE